MLSTNSDKLRHYFTKTLFLNNCFRMTFLNIISLSLSYLEYYFLNNSLTFIFPIQFMPADLSLLTPKNCQQEF